MAPFLDMLEHHGAEEVARYCIHCGITEQDIAAAGDDMVEAVERHYRTETGYDIDRAAEDLMTYGPIAEEIARLRIAKGEGGSSAT